VILEGIAGIILSAGASSRMGTEKALLEVPGSGIDFLSAQIALLKPECEIVFVVVGKNKDTLKPIIDARGAECIVNLNPERGQFSSLQRGLRAVLDYGRNIALVTHVDRLPVAPSTLRALKERFAQVYPRKWMVVPEHDGVHGHPVIAGREMVEAWLRAEPISTARDIEHQHQDRIEYLTVNDANVRANINTPEEYERLNKLA
jgi:molybdenum cofactor cytidylyltransferase